MTPKRASSTFWNGGQNMLKFEFYTFALDHKTLLWYLVQMIVKPRNLSCFNSPLFVLSSWIQPVTLLPSWCTFVWQMPSTEKRLSKQKGLASHDGGLPLGSSLLHTLYIISLTFPWANLLFFNALMSGVCIYNIMISQQFGFKSIPRAFFS